MTTSSQLHTHPPFLSPSSPSSPLSLPPSTRFYSLCGHYTRALKLFIQCGDREIDAAIEVVGKSQSDGLAHQLIGTCSLYAQIVFSCVSPVCVGVCVWWCVVCRGDEGGGSDCIVN
jgi:hypothetical protein